MSNDYNFDKLEQVIKIVIGILSTILAIYGSIILYKLIFLIVGLSLPAKKFKPTEKQYKYAVLIAARNEGHVIGACLQSIKQQDYPEDKITVIVVAHNCTDNTAEIARDAGAVVYEYNNRKQRRKGYALKYLLDQIRNDNGIFNFDGYFIVDADCLLETNFISEMNKAFDYKEYAAITSYCDIKNFKTSPTSVYDGILYIGQNTYYRRPVSSLGLSPVFVGTGLLLRSNVLQHGWEWFTLGDDTQLSYNLISRGYRITYCETAKYYDEVPTNIRISGRRKMRFGWGNVSCFFITLPCILLGLIWPFDWDKKFKLKGSPKQKASIFTHILKRLSLINTVISYVPVHSIGALLLLNTIISIIIAIFISGPMAALVMFSTLIVGNVIGQLSEFLYAITSVVRESKRIRLHPIKVLFWIITYPLMTLLNGIFFQFGGIWPGKHKPIPRYAKTTIEDVRKDKPLIKYFVKEKIPPPDVL